MKEKLNNNFKLGDKTNDITSNELVSILSLNSINPLDNIEEFSEIKNNILEKINDYLKTRYSNENGNFKKSFEEWRYNAFDSENLDQHKKILNLFNLRNKIYLQILSSLLKKWVFNNILWKDDIINLITLIESELFESVDNLAIDIKLDLLKNNFYKDENIGWLHYGYIKNWEIMSWRKICNNSFKMPSCYVKNMKEWYLEKYFNWFLNFIENNNTNYDDFIKLEENEVKSWKNNEKLTFTVPIEKYDTPHTIDLWFEFHLSKPLEQEELSSIMSMSEKYFNDGYNMDKISLAFTEMLITSWDNNLKKVLWRSFPNDKRLSDKYWKIIYIAKSRNLELAEKTFIDLKNLWFDPSELLHKWIRLGEVKFHEFWHSLFSDIKPKDNLLEELKATLYYFLYLYEEKDELEDNEKKSVIEFVIWDFIRRISQKNVKSSYQYWLLENYIFDKAVKNNLIKLENDKLSIDIDTDNFDKFLEILKDTLFDIKKIYTIKHDTNRAEEEVKFIWDIFEDNDIFIEYFKKELF